MTSAQTDILIVGAGLAGAAAATMLGRAGRNVMLIDPHTECHPEFRCEKLDESQIELLRQTGLDAGVLPHASCDREVWIVRHGRLIDRRPSLRAGIMYHDLVNAVRRQIPANVSFHQAKADGITPTPQGNTVRLSTGEEVTPRLVVLANGLNPKLRDSLGIELSTISKAHSISIGFNMKPRGQGSFAFPALTVFPERPGQRLAYLTIFPTPQGMRANLFGYWTWDDPAVRAFRTDPETALASLIPSLARHTGPYLIDGPAEARPMSLNRAVEPVRDGVLLIGDAYSTSCPAAGTGANKALTDALRLCEAHVPQWCEGDDFSAARMAAFYADPVKQRCEEECLEKALHLRRLSIETAGAWRLYRGARFAAQLARGQARSLLRNLAARRLPQGADLAKTG